MNRITVILATALACAVIAAGCSGGGSSVIPSPDGLTFVADQAQQGQTHLWGYYDVYIDIPTQTVTAVPARDVMFTANVVQFINGKPASLNFHINDTPVGSDWIDVDIDVQIQHPFPGLPQYNGYDVRGVFMGDGSATLEYNPALIYPVLGTDQFMLPDPDDNLGGPDGYTRWFNMAEFSGGGMALFQYTKGKAATPGYSPSATLNPYKYFADGLGKDDDLWTFLNNAPGQFGVFGSGIVCTRNYYLRFPNSKGIKFAYAIVANWEGEDIHPSNALEAVAVSTAVTPDVFYVDPGNKGGDLILDINVFNWSIVQMENQIIHIESSVLTNPHEMTGAEMVPVGGTENFSTYHVEIPADNVMDTLGNEYWVIVENTQENYQNDFGVPNAAGDDPLAAFFRSDLFVADKPYCPDPTVLGIDPDTVMADVNYSDVEITGTNLVDGALLAVKLSKSGSTDIVGTGVTHVDDNTITADFDFTGTASGFWDVTVTNGCGNQATGTGMLEVFSCGTLLGFTQNFTAVIMGGYPDDMPSYVSGMAGTQTGTPYAIGCGTRIGNNKLGAIAVSLNGGNPQYYSNPTGVGMIDRDVVCDSQNKVYFTDGSNYSRLRYSQFDASTGFGAVTDFGTVTSGWSIWRVTIDENDNPVALAYSGSNMKVFHWNGSGWDTTDVPSTVVQGYTGAIGDFEWNPTFNQYAFVRQMSNNQVDLYAIDTAGNLVKSLTDIFNGAYSTALPGIHIDVKNPNCDVVCWGGFPTFGAWSAPFARMNAGYGGKVVTSQPPAYGQLTLTGGRGQVAKGSGMLCVGAHYINVYGKVPIPSDW